MVLPLLIRYTLLAANRRWTVEVSLSALVAVLVFLLCVLLTELAGDVVPPAKIQFALAGEIDDGQGRN